MSTMDSGGAVGFMPRTWQSPAGMRQRFGLRKAVASGPLSIAPEAATNAEIAAELRG